MPNAETITIHSVNITKSGTSSWFNLGLVTAGTAVGEAISRVMALFAKVFGFLY